MRVWLSAVFFISYVAVQLGLPALQGFAGHRSFRWSMFSNTVDRYDIFAEYAGGIRESLAQIQKRTGHARLFREEIDKRKLVPPYLCSLAPTPVIVLFQNRLTGEEIRYPCR